jgi:hypothetical protein
VVDRVDELRRELINCTTEHEGRRLSQRRPFHHDTSMNTRSSFCVVVIAVSACGVNDRTTENVVATDSPRVVVDSIFPVEEEIRRFKDARNGATATELSNASPTRDALVARLIQAIEASDTAQLSAMVMNAAEFINLYYPTSIYARPPYRQSPELLWFLMQQNSQKGIGRVLTRYAGHALRYVSYACRVEPADWGETRIWEQCTVQWSPTPDAPSPFKLFSGIIERDGRFKFVSYANDL